jgi:hypothetical protein
VRSVFIDEKTFSMVALSHTLLERRMLQTMPLSAVSRWNCSLLYLAALIGVMQQPSRLAVSPDGHQRTSATSCAVIVAHLDQPTTCRKNRSTTAAAKPAIPPSG